MQTHLSHSRLRHLLENTSKTTKAAERKIKRHSPETFAFLDGLFPHNYGEKLSVATIREPETRTFNRGISQ